MKRFGLPIDGRVLVIALCAVFGLVAGLAFTSVSPKSYASSTVLFIGSPAAGDSAGAYQGDLFSQQRAATYAQLFSGDDLAVKVNDDLRLGLTPTELASKVTAASIEKTVLLQVDVIDSTPQGAADIANSYASNFAAYVGQLEQPQGRGQPNSLVSVVTRAEPPVVPSSPSSTINLAGGLFLGLLVGFAIVYFRGRFDSTVRTPAAAAAATGAPVLGSLPADARREQTVLTLPDDSTSPYAEQARKLRTTLQFVDSDLPIKSILVSAADSRTRGEIVAANLALMLAEVGRSVVVLDADLRSSAVSAYLGASSSAIGLVDVLTGAVMIENATTRVHGNRISLVAAGRGTDTPGEDIATDLMRNVVSELSRTFDYVVVSAAPAAQYADAAVIGATVDGVVLVARLGGTDTSELREAATAVRSTGARVLGSALIGGAVKRGKVTKAARPAEVRPPWLDTAAPHTEVDPPKVKKKTRAAEASKRVDAETEDRSVPFVERPVEDDRRGGDRGVASAQDYDDQNREYREYREYRTTTDEMQDHPQWLDLDSHGDDDRMSDRSIPVDDFPTVIIDRSSLVNRTYIDYEGSPDLDDDTLWAPASPIQRRNEARKTELAAEADAAQALDESAADSETSNGKLVKVPDAIKAPDAVKANVDMEADKTNEADVTTADDVAVVDESTVAIPTVVVPADEDAPDEKTGDAEQVDLSKSDVKDGDVASGTTTKPVAPGANPLRPARPKNSSRRDSAGADKILSGRLNGRDR